MTAPRSDRERRIIARLVARAAEEPEALFDDLRRLVMRTAVLWFVLGFLLAALPWFGSAVL